MISSKDIFGIVLLNKPLNVSSNQAVQKVKRIFKVKKAGHTGSLDLLATGMLPICINQATKFSSFFLNADKKYNVTALLGYESTTGDEEGEKVKVRDPNYLEKKYVNQVLNDFLGEQEQIPPMYSAIKYQGKRLYKLARKGITVPRGSRKINIYSINMVNFNQHELILDITCSKGTYIRTLVEDIGKKLGCGAYVKSLDRSGVANLDINKMISLNDLETLNELGSLYSSIISLEEALSFLPIVKIMEKQYDLLKNGLPIKLTLSGLISSFYRIFLDNNVFLGVGWLENNTLYPKQMLQMKKK